MSKHSLCFISVAQKLTFSPEHPHVSPILSSEEASFPSRLAWCMEGFCTNLSSCLQFFLITQLPDFLAYESHSFLLFPFCSGHGIVSTRVPWDPHVIFWLLRQASRLRKLTRELMLTRLLCHTEMFKHRSWSDPWFRKIIMMGRWGMN